MNRFGSNVQSVIRLQQDADGGLTPVVIHEVKKKRRKSRGLLRYADDYVQQMARAQRTMADSYLTRHAKSCSKTRDGWIRDMPLNLMRATRKGAKKIRVWKLVPTIG